MLKKFRNYCNPRKNEVFERYKFWQRDQREGEPIGQWVNEVFERYKFWQRDQREGEPIDQWVNDLRILLSSCEYEDQKQSNLRDRIVFGVADIRVKERLLCESDLTLAKALDICHAAEASKVQMKVIASDSQQRHEVNILSRTQESHTDGKQPSRGQHRVSQAPHPDFKFSKEVTVGIAAVSIRHTNAVHMVQPVRNAKDGTTVQRRRVQEENLPARDRSH